MKRIFIVFFILSSFLIFSQEDMTSYSEKNNYYTIKYPSKWQISENSNNYNQVSFYPQDEKIMASIIYGNLGIKVDAKYLLDETLKYLEVENLLKEEDSYASEEELKNWNADSANMSIFNMAQEGVIHNCILIIIIKGTFYYSVMFVVNSNNLEDSDTFLTINNMLNSFKILK